MADVIYGPKDQPKVTLVLPPEYYGRASASDAAGPAVIYAFPSTWVDTDYQWPKGARSKPKGKISGGTIAIVAVSALALLGLGGAALYYSRRKRAPVSPSPSTVA